MAKAFSVASWNVEHFKNTSASDPARIKRVTEFISGKDGGPTSVPDIFALFEVEGKDIYLDFTEPIVEVAVAEDTCHGCGGRLEHEGVRVVYATDIPPVPRPQVTGYRVQICRCRSCGKQVRGRHPDVAPDQYGPARTG